MAYTFKRPVKILNVSEPSEYLEDHLIHFFNNYSLKHMMEQNEEFRDRAFEMITKHGHLFDKFFGEAFDKSRLNFERLLEEGDTSPVTQDYKRWLAKQ